MAERIIAEVRGEEVAVADKHGPRIEKTRVAQQAVEEFLASGFDACEVDWKSIDQDFDMAKRAVAYRISHSKYMKLDGSGDLSMRSNRAEGMVYLVHSGKMPAE